MIIQKSDKGNSVVNVDRQDCRKKINNILSDQQTFTIVKTRCDKVLKKLVESNSMIRNN